MVIHTNNIRVLNARKTVLKLIISDHPFDCLVCAKSGDCELQSLAIQCGIREFPISLRIVGVSPVISSTVDSIPTWQSPPIKIASIRPSMSATTSLALVGLGLPEILAGCCDRASGLPDEIKSYLTVRHPYSHGFQSARSPVGEHRLPADQ